MSSARRRLGDFGEAAAAALLARAGYELLERKWRCAIGEIDLVARDGGELVFVEVRTRRGDTALAAESVSRAKRDRLARLAAAYLEAHHVDDDAAWRIDVVAIGIGRDGRIAQIEHIQSAIESPSS